MKKNKLLGFTLAETLITLIIIGVVAALTVPTLMKKHEKHVIETGLKKTYAQLAELFKRSEVDNGPFQEWDFSLNSNDFVDKYFAPYVKLTKCSKKANRSCFAGLNSTNGTYTWLTPNKELTGHGYTYPKYILDDGRSILIRPYTYGPTKIVEFIVDVNGPRGKSISGQDVFWFTRFCGHQGNHFATGANGENGGTANRPEAERVSGCKQDSNGSTCSYFIQQNGWKFPDDYPIKF